MRYFHLATKIVVKPDPSPASLGVPALFPDPVKDIPGNLEELSVGVLVEDGAELGVGRRQQHGEYRRRRRPLD